MWTPLADTLIQLVLSVQAPPAAGLTVTEADIEIPLEVRSMLRQGELVFFGTPPHSRWKSGFLPEAHIGRLRIELMEKAGSGW